MIVVLGYGNTLRGDDGAGPAVADRVAAAAPGVRTLAIPMLMPEHAPIVADAELAIFVDASVDGAPGEVLVQPVEPEGDPGAFGHLLSARALLGMAAALYGGRARGIQVSIGAATFGVGAPMSEAVAEGVECAAGVVIAMVSGSASAPPGPSGAQATRSSPPPSSPTR